MTETEEIAGQKEVKAMQAKVANDLDKAIKAYIEKGNNKLLVLRTVNDEVAVDGDSESVEKYHNYEHKEDVNSIVKTPETDESLKMKTTRVLPKLKAPLDLENEDKFWKDKMVREQVSIYFKYLNWKRSKGKPGWWPKSLSFEKFQAISYNTLRQNKLILEAILNYHNLNPETHCEFPEMPPKKKKVDKRKPKTPREKEMTEERVDEPSGDDDEDISDLNNSHNSGRKRKRPDNEGEMSDEDQIVIDRLKNRGVLRKMHKPQEKSLSHSPSNSPSKSPPKSPYITPPLPSSSKSPSKSSSNGNVLLSLPWFWAD